MRIPLSDIFISSSRQRQDKPLDDLIESMGEHGQITAITVRPPSDRDREDPEYSGQPWVLVAGERRYLASAMLGWSDIEGYQREEMSELVSEILELHENLKRKALDWKEEVAAKARLVALRQEEDPDLPMAAIAREIGETKGNLSKDLKTARAIKDNPSLAASSSKKAALNAAESLAAQRDRAARVESAQRDKFIIKDRIQTADARDFVKSLPDDSIDLALIDGPYGIDYFSMARVEAHVSKYDDDPKTIFALYEELFPELVRVTRETGWIILFCSTQLERELRRIAAAAGLHAEEKPWIWYKPNASSTSRFPHLHASSRYEMILPINCGKGRLHYTCEDVLPFEVNYGKEDRFHGVQRPIDLLQEIIKRTTYTGDTVLDCFMGSGSTLAAAASLARQFYGCDANPALRDFAIAFVEANYKPIAKHELEASERRFAERDKAAQRPVEPRAEGGIWSSEVLDIGEKLIGYIRYDGHNLAQLHDTDVSSLDRRLENAIASLTFASDAGLLNPTTCSPEDVTEFLSTLED